MKDFIGYEGLYAITTCGKVWSYKSNRFLTLEVNKGYHRVRLYKGEPAVSKRFQVHRMVALTYIPNPENKETVNHIDGNKQNNCINNLEWNTFAENNQHAYTSGIKTISDYHKQMASKTVLKNCTRVILQIELKTGQIVGEYPSAMEASRIVGVGSPHISQVCKGKRKHTGGYSWCYKDEYKSPTGRKVLIPVYYKTTVTGVI